MRDFYDLLETSNVSHIGFMLQLEQVELGYIFGTDSLQNDRYRAWGNLGTILLLKADLASPNTFRNYLTKFVFHRASEDLNLNVRFEAGDGMSIFFSKIVSLNLTVRRRRCFVTLWKPHRKLSSGTFLRSLLVFILIFVFYCFERCLPIIDFPRVKLQFTPLFRRCHFKNFLFCLVT